MDDQRAGAAFRAVRVHRHLRQEDVALTARCSRAAVSRIERGHLSTLSVEKLRAVAAALDIRVEIEARWRAGELGRLLSGRHTAMHEEVARRLAGLPAWTCEAEASFSIYGERGVIDLLAWHASRRALLVIELKTDLTDPAGLIAQVGRYRRLSRALARERGWVPETVSAWAILADTDANHRRLSQFARLLRNAFPADGRTMRRWLEDPLGSVAALSFLANAHGRNVDPTTRAAERVQRPARAGGAAPKAGGRA